MNGMGGFSSSGPGNSTQFSQIMARQMNGMGGFSGAGLGGSSLPFPQAMVTASAQGVFFNAGARNTQFSPPMPAHKRQKGAGGQVVPMGDPGTLTAEVRFDDPGACQQAIAMLNSTDLGGNTINVQLDARSQDQTRLIASNLHPGLEWQEVKDYFSQAGRVAFVEVHGQKKHGPKLTGEIRYDAPQSAQAAFQLLQGSTMEGTTIQIQMDPSSKDQTKLLVSNLPPGTGWQDLKDHFAQLGTPVAYAGINAPGGCVGEVRYDDPSHASTALRTLNGSMLC